MNNQTLIVYQFSILHQILKELHHIFNFDIIEAENSKLLKTKIKDLKNYIIITQVPNKILEMVKLLLILVEQ